MHALLQAHQQIVPVHTVECDGIHPSTEVEHQDPHGWRLAQHLRQPAVAVVEHGKLGQHNTVTRFHAKRHLCRFPRRDVAAQGRSCGDDGGGDVGSAAGHAFTPR